MIIERAVAVRLADTLDDISNPFGGIALTSHEELFAIAENLKMVAEDAQTDQLNNPLAALERVIDSGH